MTARPRVGLSVPQKLSTSFNVRRPAFVSLEVPEGRHNVAHRETVRYRIRSFAAPEGRHIWVALCRPFGAWPCALRIPTARAVSYILSPLTGLAKMIRTILHSMGETL